MFPRDGWHQVAATTFTSSTYYGGREIRRARNTCSSRRVERGDNTMQSHELHAISTAAERGGDTMQSHELQAISTAAGVDRVHKRHSIRLDLGIVHFLSCWLICTRWTQRGRIL
ncbi:hypothetical protein OAO87_02425 [bacterium]|nr:hypothetical protein [bacterium]